MRKIALILLLCSQLLCARVDVTVASKLPTRSADVTSTMHVGAGFFCEFRKVLMNLIHYDKEGICAFHVNWTNQFFPYKDGIDDNGWDYFFNPIKTYPDEYDPASPITYGGVIENHELHGRECVAQWLAYKQYRPYYNYVHTIINKYIEIKPHILKQVNQIYEEHLKGYLCIGVHVRYALSHVSEAPGGHPSLQAYCNEVNTILNQNSDKSCKIFLASDSHVVINHFKNIYGEKLFYIDTLRASGNEDPHLIYDKADYYAIHPDQWHRDKPGYRGGLGVLLDCLLLSKCDYFIHISSNVSDCVCFFNPNIISVYLPRTLSFRPCPQIHNKNIHNPFINPI